MIGWITGFFGGKLTLILGVALGASLLATVVLGWQWRSAEREAARAWEAVDRAVEAAEANREALERARETARRQALRALEDQRRLQERLQTQMEIVNAIERAEDAPSAPVLRDTTERLRERAEGRNSD